MTRDLTTLLAPLPPAPEPGLPPDDPRLDEILALADADDYAAAADRAEALAREGLYDIRPISFLLYQIAREEGLAGLGRIFAVTALIAGPSLEAIGPVKRRREHVNKRLVWLFTKVTDYLEYDRRGDTPEWRAFLAGLDEATLAAALAGGQRASAGLADEIYGDAARCLGRLLALLRALEPDVPAPRAAPAAAAASPSAEATPALEPGGLAAPEPAARASPPEPRRIEPLGAGRARMELVVSHPFQELCAKLEAFGALVDRGDLGRAAIVAEDVQQLIESFDPRLHFPELFAGFSARLAEHIEVIEEHLRERESMAWKARSQHYRVDLDGFVRG